MQDRFSSNGSGRITCLTADAHVGNFTMDWTDYLDAEFREEYQSRRKAMQSRSGPDGMLPDFASSTGGSADTDVFDFPSVVLAADIVAAQHADREAFLLKHLGDRGQVQLFSTGGEVDPRRQLLELEADGTVGGICLPQSAPFDVAIGGGVSRNTPAQIKASADAVNRWMKDFVSVAPERHAGTFVLALDAGMDVAVEQVHQCHRQGLRGGVFMDTNPELRGLPLYNSRFWDPLWQVCAELGVPVNLHAAAGQAPGATGGEVLWMMDAAWFNSRPLRYLLVGGVFERHPELSVALIETNANWVPEELERLDTILCGSAQQIRALGKRFLIYLNKSNSLEFDPFAEMLKRKRYALKKKPSEYFQSNVWVSITACEEDWAVRDKLGADKLMWGSDHPHNEATWPHSMAEAKKSIDKLKVPESEVRKIMGENAAKLWGFDLHKLRPLAERVGPVF
jgi:predicted TIM-barrel fold metal-dependent hydrolase